MIDAIDSFISRVICRLLGHSWHVARSEHFRYCTRCRIVMIRESTEHAWRPARQG